MQKYMDVHIYGKCSRGKVKYECSRENEWDCYKMMEQVRRFEYVRKSLPGNTN
jgi:hypothetical protein